MNEIIQAMEERRSIRKFKPDYMLQMAWENRQPSQLR